jgi:hypothetical protein
MLDVSISRAIALDGTKVLCVCVFKSFLRFECLPVDRPRRVI